MNLKTACSSHRTQDDARFNAKDAGGVIVPEKKKNAVNGLKIDDMRFRFILRYIGATLNGNKNAIFTKRAQTHKNLETLCLTASGMVATMDESTPKARKKGRIFTR